MSREATGTSAEPHQHPWGWYPVAFSREVTSGKVISRKFAESEIVIYRTETGRAHIVSPYCPHLGAHMGGARVDRELLVCPFHAFAFAPDGRCVRTGYGTPPPRGAQLTSTPVRERNGFIFAWHHQNGSPPSWEVEPFDVTGCGRGAVWSGTFQGNQIDFLENTADIGHFSTLHHVQATLVGTPHMDGHRYATDIDLSGFYRSDLVTHAHVEVFGLGYVTVRFDMPKLGISAIEFAGLTPEGGGTMTLRRITHGRLAGTRLPRAAAWVRRPASDLLGFALKVAGNSQVTADVRMWSRRVVTETPKLARGDGPIAPARRWAQRFYQEQEA